MISDMDSVPSKTIIALAIAVVRSKPDATLENEGSKANNPLLSLESLLIVRKNGSNC